MSFCQFWKFYRQISPSCLCCYSRYFKYDCMLKNVMIWRPGIALKCDGMAWNDIITREPPSNRIFKTEVGSTVNQVIYFISRVYIQTKIVGLERCGEGFNPLHQFEAWKSRWVKFNRIKNRLCSEQENEIQEVEGKVIMESGRMKFKRKSAGYETQMN